MAIEHLHMTSQLRPSSILVHSGDLAFCWQKWLLVLFVGCLKRSDRDKDIPSNRIPSIRTGEGKQELELTTKCQTVYNAAIFHDGLCKNAHNPVHRWVSSKHFFLQGCVCLWHVKHGLVAYTEPWPQNAAKSACVLWMVCQEKSYCRFPRDHALIMRSCTHFSWVNYSGSEEHTDSCTHDAKIQADETGK